MSKEHRLNLLKTLPGLLISAFFLWWTFRGFSLAEFRAFRLVEPGWIAGIFVFTFIGYTLRCTRWWFMLRNQGSGFGASARVLMTSLAANNILPLRIGDVMRIFTYAPDLNTSPSVILSTVIVEKLLDIFSLVVMIFVTLHTGMGVSPHTRLLVKVLFVVSAGGLLVLVAGARTLVGPIKTLFAKLPEKLGKVEHWLLLALEAVRNIGVFGMLWLVVLSFAAWAFEGLLYLSAMRLVGVVEDWGAPWQTAALANFAFLLPSAPGGIGPFEWACKSALISHGVGLVQAQSLSVLIHLWLLVSLTGVGGAMFVSHRLQLARRKPLLEEIDGLPAELP